MRNLGQITRIFEMRVFVLLQEQVMVFSVHMNLEGADMMPLGAL